MRIGTRSVLFGAHCFFIHPLVLACAWWKLHGFGPVFIGTRSGYPLNKIRWALGWRGGPVFASLWKPQLWVAFFVHDLGYLGKPNMDGEEGETHPLLGAAIMRRLFGEPWGKFCLYHSRFYAKQHDQKLSPLCVADKLSIALVPWWVYVPMCRLTHEIHEYSSQEKHRGDMARTQDVQDWGKSHTFAAHKDWFLKLQDHMRKLIAADALEVQDGHGRVASRR